MFGNILQNVQSMFGRIVSGAFQPQARSMRPNYTQADILRQSVLRQTPYTAKAAGVIKNVPIKPFTSSPDQAYLRPVLGRVTPTPTLSNTPSMGINQGVLNARGNPQAITTFRHEALHAMDASIPNQPRNYQVTNSQGFSNTLKTHNPYAFNTIYDQMYAPGSMYNPQNIPSKNTEMMAYYGESGNKPLLSNPKIAGYYRGVYRPISLAPLDMNMVYPSPEQKRYEQQFSRSYRRK